MLIQKKKTISYTLTLKTKFVIIIIIQVKREN